MKVVNPKDGAVLETNLSDSEAVAIVSAMKGEFPRSLSSRYPKISDSQYYWIHKLAYDFQNPVFIQLDSDLESFIRQFEILQFRVGEITIPGFEKLRELGKVKFFAGERVVVFSGERCVGKIEKDKFFPSKSCPEILQAQVLAFSAGPIEFLELFGKATGYCCICSRLLTNEGSVERGIGPVCAERYGL